MSNFRAWNLSCFVKGSHGQVMVFFSGSLVFRLQPVPALREPFRSQSISVGPICCTSELCNESSAAGEPCCDLNALPGSGKAGRWSGQSGAVHDVI